MVTVNKTVAVHVAIYRFSKYAMHTAHFGSGNFAFRRVHGWVLLGQNVREHSLRRRSDAHSAFLGYDGFRDSVGRALGARAPEN
jgi:hypothetical protein